MYKILIIADDLTGAADCAAGCAEYGLETVVALHDAGAAPEAEVLAVDADTRSTSPEQAAAETARLVRRYPAEIVYKKIDSTLRGNAGAEVAAAVEAYRAGGRPEARAVVAPAFPAMGRTTRGGRQYVRGSALGPPLKELFPGATICGAETDDDLREAARLWAGDARGALWVGSGGLMRVLPEALGLPRKPRPQAPRATGPVLFAIGSPSPTAQEQVAALQETGSSAYVVITGERAAIADAVAQRAGEIGALVLSGGETARAVLSALGIATLRVLGELAPGVPISAAEGSRRLTIVTKAGDFGSRETLDDCLGRLCANGGG